jgi:hypothetical protein
MTHEGCKDQIAAAIEAVKKYVTEITGQAPTEAEIARALTRFFVLKEIGEHIEMQRENPQW